MDEFYSLVALTVVVWLKRPIGSGGHNTWGTGAGLTTGIAPLGIETYYAHTKRDCPQSEWQLLRSHLEQTARLAAQLADKFGVGSLGYAAGLLHDAGKYSCEFQQRLLGQSAPVDHSTAGARLAVEAHKAFGFPLAYAIAGHHGGLPNGDPKSDPSSLAARLDPARTIPDSSAFNREIRPVSITKPQIDLGDPQRRGFALSFLTRMVYSCLVDADFRDTEAFCTPRQSQQRTCGLPSLDGLLPILDDHLDGLCNSTTFVNRTRAAILAACRERASARPGWFSLTVPTGGGKTLSSLAFALRHAVLHHLDRVIYVIPFTSIIEQNAAVFRSILSEQAVLEHHSNYEPPSSDGEEQSVYDRLRLAAENWDSPVVATTNVQFFESLFGAQSSRCRKLHNIARSIVILDEAQMLPVEYLRPCLTALAELVLNYGTSVVLCTATQPNLAGLLPDSPQVVELAPDPPGLYQSLKRVRVESIGFLNDNQLAKQLREQEQVLCIVNTRRHAREVYKRLGDLPGTFHLSARMCPAHRSDRLKAVREALAEDRPCRLVSTQVVEAGVDVDFPVVYRSMAGIDSIAQAAGRCNREGLLDISKVYLFEPDVHGRAPGFLSRTADVAQGTLRRHADPLSLESVADYFRNLYSIEADKLDAKGILRDLEESARSLVFPFRDIAAKFCLIEQDSVSVIVPWGSEAADIRRRFLAGQLDNTPWRRLQKYTVQVYRPEFAALVRHGAIQAAEDTFHFLVADELYSQELGLLPLEHEDEMDVLVV